MVIKEMVDSGAGVGFYKMNLEHFVVPESKEVIFKKIKSYHKEIITNLKGLHWQNLGKFGQQNN